jgi:hypothetical protein
MTSDVHTASGPLFYSLAEFREIIFAAFEVAGVRSVMDVGPDAGTFTKDLADWVSERDAILYCVDPVPGESVRQVAQSSPHLELLEVPSHEALEELRDVDAYLLEGDHNYFTATRNFERIEAASRAGQGAALVIARGVDWPWGRRDLYFDPSRLPKEAVHPYTFDLSGVPWCPKPTPDGLRSHSKFAVATEEGGPANGVSTAIEDFLRDRPDYRTIHVPCLFGLMFIFPAGASWADTMVERLGIYDENPLLSRLERNRVGLYLEVLELQDELDVERTKAATYLAQLEGKVQDLEGALAITRDHLHAADERPIARTGAERAHAGDVKSRS